jgi:uncharacterized protein (DUF362 family)
MSFVSLVKNQEGREGFVRAVIKSLELINYSFEKDIKNIIIKPNLCYYWDYTTGQTTDPYFIAALIDVLRAEISQDIDISIIESDASAMKCKYVFKMLGYEKMAKKCNVNLVNISEVENESINIKIKSKIIQLSIPKIISESDLLINVPKIKYTMDPIKITCALKNIFGCNPYPKKFEYHSELGEYIVACNKAMKFNLCVADGDIVSGIKPKKLGLVMASVDPVSFDTAASEIAGINPKSLKYLQLAQTEGIGKASFIPRGENINNFKSAYPKINIEKKFMSFAYKSVLKIGLGNRLGL